MTTKKERDLIDEIMDLAIGVNEAGDVSVNVELNTFGLTMRIAPAEISDAVAWEWIYYPRIQAYFEGGDFDSQHFEGPAEEFIAELKKHHPQYDADGFKL